jgi:hypothetical protein
MEKNIMSDFEMYQPTLYPTLYDHNMNLLNLPDSLGVEEFYNTSPTYQRLRPSTILMTLNIVNGGFSMSSKANYISERINTLLKLPARWDGDQAKEISLKAAEIAATITYIVLGDPMVAQFFPLPDGGIQAEWYIEGNELEIEIDSEGHLYSLSSSADGILLFEEEFTLEDCEIINKLSQEVKRLTKLLCEK